MPDWLKSIKARIIIPTLLIIIVTGAFVLLSLGSSDTLKMFDNHLSLLLYNNLESKAAEIDSDISSVVNQTATAAEQITKDAEPYYVDYDTSQRLLSLNRSQLLELNSLTAPYVQEIARLWGVSGAYVIWAASPDYNDQVQEGLYIIDSEPTANIPNKSDLSLLRGSSNWAASQSMSLSNKWNRFFGLADDEVYLPRFSISQMQERLISIPGKIDQHSFVDPAKSRPSDYSVWSYETSFDGSDVLIYYLPLLTSEMKIIGIMGIEINVSTLLSALPDRDPGYNSSAYMVALGNPGSSVTLSRELVKTYALNDIYSLFSDERSKKVIRLQPQETSELHKFILSDAGATEKLDDLLIAVHKLKSIRFAEGSVRDNDHELLLMEAVLETELGNPVESIARQLYILITSALTLALLASLAASSAITRPVIMLSNKLKVQKPEEAIKLPRFNISELDHLSESIESMSENLIDASFRTAAIIDLVDLPIASFEEQPEQDTVVVSSAMGELLDFKTDNRIQTRLSMSTWNALMKQLLSHPEEGTEDIFKWKAEADKPVKWLRIRQARSNGRESGILIDVTEDILRQRRLIKERDYDNLTMLLNRRAFVKRLKSIIDKATEEQYAVLLFIDLDDLKQINDNYGHHFGDQYIRLAAAFVSRLKEKSGLSARFAGDEFAVFSGLSTNLNEARKKIDGMLTQMERYSLELPDGTTVRLRLSMGAAVYPLDSSDCNELIEFADFAMYQRKKSGKNGLTWFDKTKFAINQLKIQQKSDLEEILRDELLDYNSQPVYASGGELHGYDLMLKPMHENVKLPLDLIKIAVDNDCVIQLEALMMKKASEWVEKNLINDNKSKVFVHLFEAYSCQLNDDDEKANVHIDQRQTGSWTGNYSSFDNVFYTNLAERIVFVLDVEGPVPAQVIRCSISRCRQYSAEFALAGIDIYDDNRSLFDRNRPDYIRFDMSLIRNIDLDDHRKQLLSTMIDYCRYLGVTSIISGIDTAAEYEIAQNLGADLFQGFYLKC